MVYFKWSMLTFTKLFIDPTFLIVPIDAFRTKFSNFYMLESANRVLIGCIVSSLSIVFFLFSQQLLVDGPYYRLAALVLPTWLI